MSQIIPPLNLQKWIDEHREILKPPVCNKQIFELDDFIVMVVGGPNKRSDYHYNEGPELFYQLEGEMVLAVVDGEEFKDIPITAGEMFLLPPKMLHSPRRMENSIGLVVERKRLPHEKDALLWFCENCHHKLYEESFMLDDIEEDLPKIFNKFFGSLEYRTCSECGTVMEKN